MSHLVDKAKIPSVSGFLLGHNPPRTKSFIFGLSVALLVWSITPLAWLTVIIRFYKKGELISIPSKNIFAKIWYLHSLVEIPFSIYLAFITWRAGKEAKPPKVSFETLQILLTKTLTVGLPIKEGGLDDDQRQKHLRNGKTVTSTTTAYQQSNGDAQLRGIQALKNKHIDESEAGKRRERLRSWFFFAPIEDIHEDNVREWLAWAFAGRKLDDAKQDKKCIQLIDEGLEMVKLGLNWPNVKPGYNPKVRAIRLTLDPIRVISRPLGFYVVTNYVTYATIAWLYAMHGFRFERSGRCDFLVKKPESGTSPSKRSLPIVFLHGLGIGLGQYIPMLTQLARHKDGVVILLQPHISTAIFSSKFLDPPGKDEQAQATISILQKHKMERCTTLSHSNGTMVLGWLLRVAPEMFERNILVDPVSFCMWEGSVCYSFIHRRWASGVEALLGYFVGRELGIAHTIGRSFIWFDMILWTEEFPSLHPKDLHIIFAEKDLLVDVPGSVKYLQTSGVSDDCISVLRNYQHGQALMHKGHGMLLSLKHAGVRM